MQKLVTIYVDNLTYMGDKWIKASMSDRHGFVEEHLQNELNAGWKVIGLNAFGGVDGSGARGWLVVALEK
jgi:hypothetical protein